MDSNHRGRNRFRGHYSGVFVNSLIISICIALYCLNRLVLKKHVGGWFLHGYFNDFLAGMIILAYSNLLFIVAGKEEYSFNSLPRIISLIIPCGLFWEFVMPMFRYDSVTDVYDIFVYAIGGTAYWLNVRLISEKNDNGRSL